MFKSIYTTRMSGNSKVLEKRFEKINAKPVKCKRLIAVICVIILAVACAFSTLVMAEIAEDNTEYTLDITNNGEVIEFKNKPFIEKGEVYVPLTELFTKLGLMESPNAEITMNDGIILIKLYEKNLNEDIPADYIGYLYKIEIGKSELIINPEELVPGHTPEDASNVAETMSNEPVLKSNVIYVPFSYAERIVERADALQSPPDRYKLEVVYSGATLSVAYPISDYYEITQSFGKRVHPITGEETFHTGIDFSATEGTPVLAGIDGKVIDEGFDNEYGNYVIVANDSGVEILYGHLSQIARHGAYDVKRDDAIGESGNTGMSTGPHLHMEVKINDEYVDPQLYLEEGRYDKLVMSLEKKIPQALEQSEYQDADYKIISVKCTSDGEMGFVKLQLSNYNNINIGIVFDYFDDITGWSGVVIGENYEAFELLVNSSNVEIFAAR